MGSLKAKGGIFNSEIEAGAATKIEGASGIGNTDITIDGLLKLLKSGAEIADVDLVAGSGDRIEAKTGFTDSTFTFTDPFDAANPKQRAFRKFATRATAMHVDVIGEASFGKIELGRAIDFNATSGAPGLPADSLVGVGLDFANPTVIDGVRIKGLRNEPIAMDNAFFNAHSINSISVVFAAGGAGDRFGFGAEMFPKGATYKDDDGTVRLKQRDLVIGDNLVNLAGTRLTVRMVDAD